MDVVALGGTFGGGRTADFMIHRISVKPFEDHNRLQTQNC